MNHGCSFQGMDKKLERMVRETLDLVKEVNQKVDYLIESRREYQLGRSEAELTEEEP